MNVYDSARMADVLAPLGYPPAEAPDGADMVILNTCHIREKAAEKVFSELGRLRMRRAGRRAEADGRRMIIAVAGCVAQAEGEEIMARAPFVDIVFGPQTYHRLPEMVARASRAAGERCSTPISRWRASSTSCRATSARRRASPPSCRCRKAATSSAPSASCPIRAAPNSRARPPRSSPRPGAGGRRRARDHAARPERQRLSWRRARTAATWGLGRLMRALAEIDGLARIRYTTVASARHGRRPDRRPSRRAAADAVPASAGAERVRPHPGRDEPQAHSRRLTAGSSTGCAGAARPGAVVRLHRRVSRRDRRRFRAIPAADHARSVSPRPTRSNTAPAPARRPPAWTIQVPEAVKTERLARSSSCSTPSRSLQPACRRPHHAGPARPHRAAARPAVGRSPYLQPVHGERRRKLAGTVVDVRITAADRQQPCRRAGAGGRRHDRS